MFWSSQAAKSRNCLFNFILGARGVGKTFCKKEDVINAYLKSGEEFVYMRRYKEELKEFKKSTSDKKLKSKVDNIVKKIDLILDKKTETDNLKLFIIASNDLLSMYYDDYNYYFIYKFIYLNSTFKK